MQGVEARWELKWEVGELAFFKQQYLFQKSISAKWLLSRWCRGQGRNWQTICQMRTGFGRRAMPPPPCTTYFSANSTIRICSQIIRTICAQSVEGAESAEASASRAWWISLGMFSQNLRRQGILNKIKMKPSENLWIFQFSIKGKGDFSPRNKNQSRFCRCLTSQPWDQASTCAEDLSKDLFTTFFTLPIDFTPLWKSSVARFASPFWTFEERQIFCRGLISQAWLAAPTCGAEFCEKSDLRLGKDSKSSEIIGAPAQKATNNVLHLEKPQSHRQQSKQMCKRRKKTENFVSFGRELFAYTLFLTLAYEGIVVVEKVCTLENSVQLKLAVVCRLARHNHWKKKQH